MKTLIFACSVCFGDPHSLMSKGVFWGVLFLMGVVGFVLASIASVIVIWTRRARKVAASPSAGPS